MPNPRVEVVHESSWTPISLSEEEEEALKAAGRNLAKGTDRFGQTIAESTSSVIRINRVAPGQARIYVSDMIGMVSTETLQLHVEPKIPRPHLIHLLVSADVLPRLALESGLLESDDSFASLVCHWFVQALDRLLALGLARDYHSVTEETTAVRGRLQLLASARLFYRGRLAVISDLEDFDFDTPLNRLLLHAARIIAASTQLSKDLRKSALRAAKRMDGVGDFRHSDFMGEIDRRTANYADAVLLGRHVIRSIGRTLDAGVLRSWTFLFRTPEPVEAGVRAELIEALPISVRKKQQTLEGSTLTVNPDLVFGEDAALADVKYKLAGKEWDRGDLYEVVAFGAALRTPHCAVVIFRDPATDPLPALGVGDFTVSELCWPVADHISPETASAALAIQVQKWLGEAGVLSLLAAA
jgi:5-methylcytosine-specific restriction endonuclease McrBC regulatory subunit McrC